MCKHEHPVDAVINPVDTQSAPPPPTSTIDDQPVTIALTLGQVKRLALLAAGAVAADPQNTADMMLLLAVQAEGGREQDRLRQEGHR